MFKAEAEQVRGGTPGDAATPADRTCLLPVRDMR